MSNPVSTSRPTGGQGEAQDGTKHWISTTATVTTCKYQFASLSYMVIGFSTQEKFRITFDYYAHGQTFSGEFQSPTAIPQNTQFPISYNPLNPAQNSRHPDTPSPDTHTKPPLIAIGITGSIVLSLAWLAILRTCH